MREEKPSTTQTKSKAVGKRMITTIESDASIFEYLKIDVLYQATGLINIFYSHQLDGTINFLTSLPFPFFLFYRILLNAFFTLRLT